MDRIGRKMYLDFGTHIIAVEKYIRTSELLEELHLDENKVRAERSPDKNIISLYNIVDVCGQKIEQYIGPSVNQQYGCTIDEYLTYTNCWFTADEFIKRNMHEVCKSRESIELPDKDLKYKLGYVLTAKEYNMLKNPIKVFVDGEFSESFWGVLCNREDIEAYKKCEDKNNVLFVAMNTTINGHIDGTIYSGYIKNGTFYSNKIK